SSLPSSLSSFPPSFFFYPFADHLPLHSFPTRRSSDLIVLPVCPGDQDAAVIFFHMFHDPGNLRRSLALAEDHLRLSRPQIAGIRSEEHTSELQSRFDLVCRLLLEKKKVRMQVEHT